MGPAGADGGAGGEGVWEGGRDGGGRRRRNGRRRRRRRKTHRCDGILSEVSGPHEMGDHADPHDSVCGRRGDAPDEQRREV